VTPEYIDAQEGVPVGRPTRLAKARVRPVFRVGVTRAERVAEREGGPRRGPRRPRPPGVEGEAAHMVVARRGNAIGSRVEVVESEHRLLTARPGSIDKVEQTPERALVDLYRCAPPDPE